MKINKNKKCCFCDEPVIIGNNPEPVKKHPNVCCDECNQMIVLPQRQMKLYQEINRISYTEEEKKMREYYGNDL